MSDDEIKHEQDTPVDISTDGSDATSETTPLPPEFPSVSVNLPIAEPKGTSRKGLIILLVLLGILSLGGGSAFAYYMVTTNKPKPAVANVTSPSPSATPKSVVADAVLYQTTVPGKNVGACSTAAATLYRQPLSGDKATKVLDVPDYQEITQQDSYKNQVVIVTDATCASKTGSQILYSTDSGNTFSKLYENPSKDDAITSIKFDSYGKSVAFGYLASGTVEATVKQLDVSSKATQDLLTASKAGVYIKGFNFADSRIYFVEGCYGCDASSDAVLSVYDTQKRTVATLYEEDTVSYDTHFNKNFSKGIKIRTVSTTTTNTKGSDNVNYVIDEFDTTNGTMNPLTTSELTGVPPLSIAAGYTDDGMVYYVKEKNLNVIDSNKKSSVLLTSVNPIVSVYDISKDSVIYKNIYTDDGSQGAKTDVYTDRVILYDIKTKKSTPIVTFKDRQSVILGITWK